MHAVFALLCFVVVIHWLIFPYPSGLLHWHCGNLTIAPVPAKQPWWIWINTSCEFIMNDCITTTKQSTTKPCAYFLGYTVHQVMDKLTIKLSKYNAFYSDEVQQESFECSLFLIYIIPVLRMNIWQLLKGIPLNINCGKNILSPIYADWELLHLKRLLLYITLTTNASMQESVLPDHTQKTLQDLIPLQKGHLSCRIWRSFTKHPNYLIITVNRFNYINDIITKSRNLITLGLRIILSAYKSSLQATLDHHGNSIQSFNSHSAVASDSPFNYRSRNRHRNLWDRQRVTIHHCFVYCSELTELKWYFFWSHSGW